MADNVKDNSNVRFLYQSPAEVPGESHLCGPAPAQTNNAGPDLALVADGNVPENRDSHVLVPVEPHFGVLVSMALCLDHGFGLLSAERQESRLHDMRKLYDEVVGRGYYQAEREDYYQGFVSAAARAEFTEQPAGIWTPIGD